MESSVKSNKEKDESSFLKILNFFSSNINGALAIFIGLTLSLTILGSFEVFPKKIYDWKNVSVSPLGIKYLCTVVVVGTLFFFVGQVINKQLLNKKVSFLIGYKLFRLLITGLYLGAIFFLLSYSLKPVPELDNFDERHYIPVFPSIERDPVITYAVFFPNGSANLSREQIGALKKFFEPLSNCAGLEISVQGFASSAQYPSNNSEKNLELIVKRLNSVQVIAKQFSMNIIAPSYWPDLASMAASRLVDDGEGNSRFIEREGLNRRVELHVVNLGECSLKKNKVPSAGAKIIVE